MVRSKLFKFLFCSVTFSATLVSFAGFEYKTFKESGIWGVQADRQELDTLSDGLKMPEAQGFLIPTLNYGGGYMTAEVNSFAAKLIAQASSFKKPILEVGAAYGVATLPLLSGSTVPIIANDLSPENLLVLRNRAPKESLNRLFLNSDRFPNQLSLESNSLSAILICRVFHFLKGGEIETGLAKAYDWLEKDGILVITTASPYQKPTESFIPRYEKLLKSGRKWPGYVEDYGKKVSPGIGANIHPFLHVMDIQVLSRALRKAGFEIVEAEYLDTQKHLPQLALDGREATAIIARKKPRQKPLNLRPRSAQTLTSQKPYIPEYQPDSNPAQRPPSTGPGAHEQMRDDMLEFQRKSIQTFPGQDANGPVKAPFFNPVIQTQQGL